LLPYLAAISLSFAQFSETRELIELPIVDDHSLARVADSLSAAV